jgi:hypothetical protein
MSAPSASRFTQLAKAMRERGGEAAPAATKPAALHKPSSALGTVSESLKDRILRLEQSLPHADMGG